MSGLLTQYGKLDIELDPRTGHARMRPGSRPAANPGNRRVAASSERLGRAETASTRVAASSERLSRTRTASEQLGRTETASKRLAASSGSSRPSAATDDAHDSKLEATRHRYWVLRQLAGAVTRVIHHPFTIPLTPELTYTPDFFIEFPDGQVWVEEVKGHLKMKNARDSITRLKMAADRFPMWKWVLTTRPRTRWAERVIGGRHSVPIPTFPTTNQPRRIR